MVFFPYSPRIHVTRPDRADSQPTRSGIARNRPAIMFPTNARKLEVSGLRGRPRVKESYPGNDSRLVYYPSTGAQNSFTMVVFFQKCSYLICLSQVVAVNHQDVVRIWIQFEGPADGRVSTLCQICHTFLCPLPPERPPSIRVTMVWNHRKRPGFLLTADTYR